MKHTGDTIGRFQVERLLGEGGIAQVYAVRHRQLGTLHALKLLTLQRPGLAERLLQEGRIQAQLRHPNVVAVTDVVEDDGDIGLIMEYVEGMALDDCLADGAMPIAEALELFEQVLLGVGAAHRAGVLHRDLKPGNILLTTVQEAVVAKVADFGIAKIASEELAAGAKTLAGTAMGPPGYMAPEQVRDSATVDARADVFALGAILYEMISGRRAFGSGDLLTTLNRTAKGEFTPLSELDPDCPFELDFAIRTALSVDPEDRFPDCQRFARALDLSHAPQTLEPIVAPVAPPALPTLMPHHETMVPDVDEVITDIPTEPIGTPLVRTPELSTDPPTAEELRSQFGLDDVDIDETLPAHAFEPATRPVTIPPPLQRRDPDAEDDEDRDEHESQEPTSSRLSEILYELLWPLLRALFHTGRYIAFPIVGLLVASVLGAQVGQTRLSDESEAVQVAEVQLAQAIEGGLPLYSDLLELGAREHVLAPFLERYKRSDGERASYAAAADLIDAMIDEVRLLEPVEDAAVLQERRELEVRLRSVQASHDTWAESVVEWESAANTLTGTLAIRGGMAEAPPGWTDPFLGAVQ
ncbi:MAG: serine/threonine protein kinase [Proteobacteria bacterium]|nr:serine/threonine protein kinase [Pseudomonadota bacterium]MCP4920401.1 serine/threonine protein kinase [Pseudomonadota bacterium]